jgi:SNF2 family DNA or RNA helicase
MLLPDYYNIYYNIQKIYHYNNILFRFYSKKNDILYKKFIKHYKNNSNIITNDDIILTLYYKLPHNTNTNKEKTVIYTTKPLNRLLDTYYVVFIVINKYNKKYYSVKRIVSNVDYTIEQKAQIICDTILNYNQYIKYNNINECIEYINDKFNDYENGSLINNIDTGLFINSYICRFDDYNVDYDIFLDVKTVYNINVSKLFHLYYLALCNGFDFQVGFKYFDTINISGEDSNNSLALSFIINSESINIHNNNKIINNIKEDLLPIENIDYSAFEDNFSDKIKIELFNYQKNNIKWMEYIEDNKPEFTTKLNINNLYLEHDLRLLKYKISREKHIIHNEKIKYKIPARTIKYEDKYCVRYVNIDISRNISDIYHSNYNKIYYSVGELKSLKDCKKEKQKGKLHMCGGIIADDVGLGKTLSTVSFLVNKRDKDRFSVNSGNADLGTMIILPNRLISQWMYEIDNYLIDKDYLNIVKIGSITDIKKLSKKQPEELKSIDIFLVSNTIFANNKYISGIVNGEFSLNIIDTKWNRIIIDEAHEILVANKLHHYVESIKKSSRYYSFNNTALIYDIKNLLHKKQRDITFNILYNLNSNYRWCLTATPFMYEEKNFVPYLYWLSDYKFNIKYNEEKYCQYDNEVQIINKYSDNNLIYNLTNYNNHFNYDKLDAFYNLLSKDDVDNFCQNFISKNSKKELQNAEVIDIPIVSEEIIYVNQTSIEKQIYDSYANQVLQTYGNRESLLFKLCTNLLVASIFNTYNIGIDSSKRLEKVELQSLEEINNMFINNLKKNLVEEEKNLNSRKDKITKNKTELLKISKLIDYFENISVKEYLDLMHKVVKQYGDKSMNKTTLKAELDIKSGNGITSFIKPNKMSIINNFVDYGYNSYYKSSVTDFISNLTTINDFIDINTNNMKLVELISTYLTILEEKRSDYKYIYHANIINKYIEKYKTSCEGKIERASEAINDISYSMERLSNQLKIMDEEKFINTRIKEPCIICLCDYEDDTEIIITKCRHITCAECFNMMMGTKNSINCPQCRSLVTMNNITKTCIKPNKKEPEPEIKQNQDEYSECVNKYGSKMSIMIKYIKRIFSENEKNRAIIFSQYNEMLQLIKQVLNDFKIKYVFCKGNVNVISKNIIKFKKNPEYRVILLSSDKANSGSNLTEASHIILIDVLNMDKERTIDIETQAIGRAVRLGQKKNVRVVRFITRNTIEETKYLANKYDLLEV